MPYAHAIHCAHDPLLMLLSYAIAVLGSLTALQMALALPPAGWARMRALFWAGGALGVGGIWAMHFIAMLGCRMPLPVSYDIGITALSAVIAWLSCWAGLAIAGSRRLSRLRLLPAGLLAGVGVAGMHYTGMAAMRMPATLHYDAGLVILSVAIAIVASWIALWLTFHHDGGARMAFGALVMAVAVSGLHYTGMAAASFVPTPVDAVVPMGLTPPRLGMVIFALTALALLIALRYAGPPARVAHPMSETPRQRATALIERYYAAFNAGDWDGMVALLHEDVVHDLNQGTRESGRAAFRAFLDRMARSYAERLREIVVMASDDGTRAAAEYVVHGEYRVGEEGLPPARGQRYVLPGGAFFAIRDDRIARVSNYYNLQDWIAQVSR